MINRNTVAVTLPVLGSLLAIAEPATASYVFPAGAAAQVQAVTNINATTAPSPATQAIVLELGTATSASVSGPTGSANALIDLTTGQLKADATSTAGFTSSATGWEFVTFSGSGTVDFSFAIDGSLSNLYPAGMVYVEPSVRIYDVTSWTSYFASTGGTQFVAFNGAGSPFPYQAAVAYDIQGVRGAGSGGCTIFAITNCTVDSAGTTVPVDLGLNGSLEAVEDRLYLVQLNLTTATFNQQLGVVTQTGNFLNTATFSFINLDGLTFESASGQFLASPVPVPPAAWLLGSALGLISVIRRKAG